MTLYQLLMLRLLDIELSRRAQKAMRRGDVSGQITQEEVDWINRKLDRVNSRRDHPMLLRLPLRTSADLEETSAAHTRCLWPAAGARL